MTAIAYRDGILACDRQLTWGDVKSVVRKYKKIKVPTLGVCVVAMSGYGYGISVIHDRLTETNAGSGKDIGEMKHDTRYGLLITSKGDVHGIYGDGRVGPKEEHENQFIAEGGAFHFLMGAMAAGATAKEAVTLACDYMDGCGCGVDVIDVKEFLQYE